MILLLASTGVKAFALEPGEEHAFGLIFFDEEPLPVEAGKATTGFIFEIPDKHYLYREKFQVVLETPGVMAKLDLEPGEEIYDAFFEKTAEVYFDEVTVPVTFVFDEGFSGAEVRGQIVFQGCSDEICFRAIRQPFVFSVVLPQAQGVTEADSPKSFWSKAFSGQIDFNQEGPLLAFLVCFIFGVLSSLSVCVLPLIPLTLSFMGVKKGDSSKNVMRLFVFVLGLVTMNAPLGMGAAWLGLKFGFQFQNPYFLAFFTLLFLLVGMWMMGVLQFQLPVKWQSGIAKIQPKGLKKAYFSGLTIGLLAFSCVGPFILPILGFISSSKNLVYGSLLMVSYSLGMSVLFVVAAFFSATWMRRFGEKSHLIKKITGLVMLLFALYFGSVWANAYVFQSDATQTGTQSDSFFRNDFAKAKDEAKLNNKGILLDFYADWCLPCKQWDLQVWSKPHVQQQILQRYIPVKIDCTTDEPKCADVANAMNVIGMPTVIFLDENFEEISGSRQVAITPTADEFLEIMKKIR